MTDYIYTIDGATVGETEYWQRLRATQVTEPHGDWVVTNKTTPSGKVLFRCRQCGRESPTPDKECPTGPFDTGDHLFSMERSDA